MVLVRQRRVRPAGHGLAARQVPGARLDQTGGKVARQPP